MVVSDASFSLTYPETAPVTITLLRGGNSVAVTVPQPGGLPDTSIPDRTIIWQAVDTAGTRELRIVITDTSFTTIDEIWEVQIDGIPAGTAPFLVKASFNAVIRQVEANPIVEVLTPTQSAMAGQGAVLEAQARRNTQPLPAGNGCSSLTLTWTQAPDDAVAVALIMGRHSGKLVAEAPGCLRQAAVDIPPVSAPVTLHFTITAAADSFVNSGAAIINAEIRGERLASPPREIAPHPAQDEMGRGTFFDGAGGVITVWSSRRSGTRQVFAARALLSDPDAGFGPPKQITDGTDNLRHPHAVFLPKGDNGEILVIYSTQGGNRMKHAPWQALDSSTPSTVLDAAPISPGALLAVPHSTFATIIWHQNSSNRYVFNRFEVASGSLSTPAEISTLTAYSPGLHAARDPSNNNVIVAFVGNAAGGRGNTLHTVRIPPGVGPADEVELVPSTEKAIRSPFVLANNGFIWVFWTSQVSDTKANIRYRRRRANRRPAGDAGAWTPAKIVSGANAGLNESPAAIADDEGGIWLFWASNRLGNMDIWYTRRDPTTEVWAEAQQMTETTEADTFPFALYDKTGTIWLFWQRQLRDNSELFFRRLFTAI
jgi:hypothetical protein